MNNAVCPTPSSSPLRVALPARLTVARVLTGLLEHLERSPVAFDAGQYQMVARRLAGELDALQSDTMMDVWLRSHPLAEEIYENLAYQHAGLCRQALEPALAAELQAKLAIAKASGSARPATP